MLQIQIVIAEFVTSETTVHTKLSNIQEFSETDGYLLSFWIGKFSF